MNDNPEKFQAITIEKKTNPKTDFDIKLKRKQNFF